MVTDLLHDEAWRIGRLAAPTGVVDVVLDTDTYNEVDDQFAVVHALLSPERIRLRAIHAAPFHNDKSSGPEDGMEKSYDEILRLLDKMGVDPATVADADAGGFVVKGSRAWMPNRTTPVKSEAADHLIAMAMARAPEDAPLYVAAIGALTNVASAILIEPAICERICVIWLGGHGLDWRHTREFNLRQDVAAAQVLFDSGVPLVHVPCEPITSHLITSPVELEWLIGDKGAIGRYLYEIVR
jgi:purine nucleosidase